MGGWELLPSSHKNICKSEAEIHADIKTARRNKDRSFVHHLIFSESDYSMLPSFRTL